MLIAFTTSCKKDDDPGIDDNSDGTFEITVNGDESFSFQGMASFNQVIFDGGTPDSKSSSLSMVCTTDDNGSGLTVIMSKIQTDGFGKGTYTFIEDPEDNEVFLSVSLYSSFTETSYFINAGTITFSNVSEKKLEGTFSIEMTSFTGETVSVTGEFSARGIYAI